MKKIIFILTGCFLIACSNNNKEQKVLTPKDLKQPLINKNKSYAQIESDQIDAYVKRLNLNVIKTGTGLRYVIFKEGYGVKPKPGNVVKVNYEVSLLNGKKCYSTYNLKPEEFLVEHDDVESGLHEGIQYLKVGSKAKLIIPSHLAHGLLGDLNKIPPRSTVIYDIELLGVR